MTRFLFFLWSSDVRNHPVLIHCKRGKVPKNSFLCLLSWWFFFFLFSWPWILAFSVVLSTALDVWWAASESCRIGAYHPSSKSTTAMLLENPGCQTWGSLNPSMSPAWGIACSDSSTATTTVFRKASAYSTMSDNDKGTGNQRPRPLSFVGAWTAERVVKQVTRAFVDSFMSSCLVVSDSSVSENLLSTGLSH
jgi:hypothetical protein